MSTAFIRLFEGYDQRRHNVKAARYLGYSIEHTRSDLHQQCGGEEETPCYEFYLTGGAPIASLTVSVMPDGSLVADNVEVETEGQHKGIATALYVQAEHDLGGKFKPSKNQEPSGKKLWAQKNRPFGA